LATPDTRPNAMKAPGMPEGFDYQEFDDVRFWEVTRCNERGMPLFDSEGYLIDVSPIDSEEKRIRLCLHCFTPQRGRYIYRMSTRTVSAIDWQCLTCYERDGGKGLRKEQFLKYCTVVEDRLCRNCFGYGCHQCQRNKCAYKGCEHPYQNVHAHHSSPRHLFEDADNWPLIPYCEVHHRIWHKTVNTKTH
jgi:hypothetical protein